MKAIYFDDDWANLCTRMQTLEKGKMAFPDLSAKPCFSWGKMSVGD